MLKRFSQYSYCSIGFWYVLCFCTTERFPFVVLSPTSGRLFLLSLYIHKAHMGAGFLPSPASILGRFSVPDPQKQGSLNNLTIALSNNSALYTVQDLKTKLGFMFLSLWQQQESSSLCCVLGMSEFPAPLQWKQSHVTYLCRFQDGQISQSSSSSR